MEYLGKGDNIVSVSYINQVAPPERSKIELPQPLLDMDWKLKDNPRSADLWMQRELEPDSE